MRLSRMLRQFCLTTLGAAAFVIFCSGCLSSKEEPARSSRPSGAKPAPVNPVPVGEIAVVNTTEHFVLIDLSSNLYVPPADTPLRAVRAGTVAAHLKTSLERKPPFVAADIIDGAPAVGDQVVQ